MMKIKILIFIFLYNYIKNCSCYSKIGELCQVETVVGTCKPFMDCPIAMRILSEDMELPPTCFWQEGIAVVCCPESSNDLYATPRTPLFSSSRIKKTNDMIGRISKHQVTPEPPGCPPLPSPKLNTPVEHPAWTKCVEYQRYFNVCVATSEDNKSFIRKNTCLQTLTDGEHSGPKQFPHMALIGAAAYARSTDDIDISWIVGGSLISDKFILTSAHVILRTRAGVPLYALLGALDKTKLQDGMLYNIISTISHEEYVLMETMYHDIALVELHERVIFNEFIRPACLPVPGPTVTDKYIIAGWGQTETGRDSLTLLHTHVTENGTKCKGFPVFDPEYMICAEGKLHESADSRQGDSGGLLMAKFSDLNCTYSVEGVVSYGPSRGKTAGVYTRVDKYMDFIMENVWPEEWETYKGELTRSKQVVSGQE